MSFSKVTKVEKREPRNEEEAEKCFPGSLFSTEVTLEMSNQMWKHFAEDGDMDKQG